MLLKRMQPVIIIKDFKKQSTIIEISVLYIGHEKYYT